MQLELFKGRQGSDLKCLDWALRYSLEALTLARSLDALFSACVVAVSADYVVHAKVLTCARRGYSSVTQNTSSFV